jgi:hypothetical protein
VSVRRTVGIAVLAVTVASAVLPPLLAAADLPTAQHHLAHSALIAGAVKAGVLFANPARDTRAGHYGWLLLYDAGTDRGDVLDVEHLGLCALSFVAGFCGQRYAAGTVGPAA